ncbi:hypothetical protein [Fischerella thermalis]|uniref:hypothetical protein n=1 Tax=Fischerella thermalis TaxID=372787 RepID=UPI000C8042B8|nr:hypothetical protein [Fischerella thermalis]MBF2068771.1 hypothetical protein [Fischerella thermalis M48_A2018_028]PLZ94158.1 hypothetical protein CI593_01060 [Fischerella thermalis CCMEE 5194]
MIISDLNHIETVESNQVISGGCGHKYKDYDKCDKYDDCDGYGKKKFRNVAIATAVAVAGDRKFYKNDD